MLKIWSRKEKQNKKTKNKKGVGRGGVGNGPEVQNKEEIIGRGRNTDGQIIILICHRLVKMRERERLILTD